MSLLLQTTDDGERMEVGGDKVGGQGWGVGGRQEGRGED